MKPDRILLVAVVLLVGLAPARALDRVLSTARIESNGAIRLCGDLQIGRNVDSSCVATPDVVQIQGSGSTGPITRITVGEAPLTDVVASAAYMPAPSGSAATDAANFAAAQAKPVRMIVFQAGTYLVPPEGYPEMRAGQEVVGQGPDRTVLRLTAQGTYDDGMLYALEKDDTAVRRLTLDYADFPEPVSKAGVLGFRNGRKVLVEDVDLTGYSRFGFAFNGSSDIRYNRGRIIRSTTPRDASGVAIAKGQQNQCVLGSEGANPVNGVLLQDIYCKGSAFDISGADVDYVRTRVDGFDFGNAYVTEQGANSVRHRFTNVKARGGRSNPATGLDSNNTSSGCFEIWSPDSIVENSECDDVGGDGMSLGGRNSRVTNNRFSKLGMQVPSNGIVSRYELGGAFSADGSLIANNAVVDSDATGDGSNLLLPYAEQSLTPDLRVRLTGNDFGPTPLTQKGLGAKWTSPGLLLSAATGPYNHSPGSIRAPVSKSFPGSLRSKDMIADVTFKANDGSELPRGLRAFAEINADNNINFYTQDISGGSADIAVPAGTFSARLISIN